MTEVFVSRPTWVEPRFQQGLDGFLGLLQSLGLNPRTIGATDYPSKSPLDEVIRLMDQCAGAVILGYPQLIVREGTLRDKPLASHLLLPTEWNHIEAGLAYARGLPLLVIHHVGVGRGIFDRGAINSFIYEINLEDTAWPLAQNVRGALEKWKTDILNLPTRKPRASSSVDSLVDADITDDHVRVLKLLADSSADYLSAKDIALRLNVSEQKGKYYLDGLLHGKYISRSMAIGSPTLYLLNAKGRALLVERSLL